METSTDQPAAESACPKESKSGEETPHAAGPMPAAPEGGSTEQLIRGKKRKFALFLGYVGAGYSGMQYNPNATTIEGVLRDAIHRAGGISKDNANDFNKIHWTRAARTDKGVSAVGQVVALKLMAEGDETLIQRINNELPAQIRVFGCVRVTNGFDARHLCDKRRYEYVLPASAFDPAVGGDAGGSQGQNRFPLGDDLDSANVGLAEGGNADVAMAEPPRGSSAAGENGDSTASANGGGAGIPAAEGHMAEGGAVNTGHEDGAAEPVDRSGSVERQNTENGQAGEDVAPTLLRNGEVKAPTNARPFVFDEEVKARLDAVLAEFKGTHNFHNFTAKVAHNNPSASRYILSFDCAGTIELQGETWVRLVIIGQSFMLHQIRKMVGTVVAVMRGAAPRDAIPLALSRERDVTTPMAPELGLFLDECYYVSYNRKWGAEREQRVALDEFQTEADAFKRDQVYPHISKVNAEEGVYTSWVRMLTDRNYGFSTWADAISGDARRTCTAKPAGKGGANGKAEGTATWGNGKRKRDLEQNVEEDRPTKAAINSEGTSSEGIKEEILLKSEPQLGEAAGTLVP